MVDLTNYFNQWIQWGSLPAEGQTLTSSSNLPTLSSVQAWSTTFDCNLTKPCWAKLATEGSCDSPLDRHESYTWSSPVSNRVPYNTGFNPLDHFRCTLLDRVCLLLNLS